jgi:GTPase involved in cell partitioning and DNA repair
MEEKEALKQLEQLNYDWQTEGLDCKLNQTDINAINTIVNELKKLQHDIKEERHLIPLEEKLEVVREYHKALSIISSIREYIEPLKKQIDNYPNETPKELLLTHINVILSKLPKESDTECLK